MVSLDSQTFHLRAVLCLCLEEQHVLSLLSPLGLACKALSGGSFSYFHFIDPFNPLTDLIVLAVLFLVILPLLYSKVLEGRIIYLRHQ